MNVSSASVQQINILLFWIHICFAHASTKADIVILAFTK